ncbi:MAG: hypothetical protein JSW60_02665 [Thermoplasmatales archaeon]|nr:MAG: hypothetical protein JSW60_02665 [Thermoplasmatales archaeon]
MKVYIAYESKYGNGKKCVEHLQTAIKKKGHNVEASPINEIKTDSLPPAELYIFSTPTHVGRPPRKMRKFLKKLEMGQEDAKYALMTTCMDYNTRSLEIMEDFLQPKKINKVSKGIKIKVGGIKGPLESSYQEKLDSFVEEIFANK